MWVWSLGRKENQNYEISHIDRTSQDPRVYKQIQNPLLHIRVCGAQGDLSWTIHVDAQGWSAWTHCDGELLEINFLNKSDFKFQNFRFRSDFGFRVRFGRSVGRSCSFHTLPSIWLPLQWREELTTAQFYRVRWSSSRFCTRNYLDTRRAKVILL